LLLFVCFNLVLL